MLNAGNPGVENVDGASVSHLKENRYRQLFQNMINGFALHEIVLDDSGKPIDYIFLEINPSFEKYTGIRASEAIGKRVTVVVPGSGNDPADWIGIYGRVALTGEDMVFEQHSEALGKWFLIHAFSPQKGQFATIFQDVTDRHAAMDSLRQREWQLRTIIDHSNEAFYIHDTEGNMEFISKFSREVYGHNLEKLQTRWDTIVTDNPMNRRGRELTERALKTGERQAPYLLEIKHSDGSSRIIEINESPVKDQQGVVTGIVGAVRDVTREYLAEKEKEHLQIQLLQSQKMEAIGRLAGGIAHDFNNLMTVVSGYCDLVRGKIQDNPDALGDIDEITRAGQRATELTRQLLAFSRKQVLELETFNLKDIVQGTENMLKRVIGEDVELQYNSPVCSPFIRADRGQIQQILVNLAINARDAMPAGGKLTIETRCVELDDDYAKSNVETVPGSYVLLAVSDTGTGMSEEVMSKIFEPFFTTKEKGKGTGLGLSTVYGIVRQIGGAVKVYSESGIGTSFKIYFPRADSSESGDTLPVFNPTQESGDETILLTEDDKEVRGVIYAILQTSGYNILEASNGQNALDICSNTEIDLLLTDIIMPGMGGIELAERLRKKNPSLRVLFMSGYTDEAIQNSGTLLPGTWFIEKPFTVTSLLNKIRTVLCS